jgi:hypothetical protein
MIGIIFFPDGDHNKGLPIMDSDEDGYPTTLATFESEAEAGAFVFQHPLSGSANCLLIDFENDELIWM